MLSVALALLAQAVPADAPEVIADEALAAEALSEAVSVEAAPEPAPALLLPKTTPLTIVIDAELGSKISAAGQKFPIRLARPVEVDGVEALPAGISGEGEVVHAKKAGLAGAAGELVLAARYLEHDGRRIELRSFRFFDAGDETLSKGQDNTGVSNVTTALAGPIGFLIGGGNTNVLPGTLASAKTRNDETFERPAQGIPAGQPLSNGEEMP
ncbi:hypothetical protein [Erythrobacter donghaensis]|uniref:hypothetical protein n=1 Tax=Erythrobacter donghaensis TaxID=267135 RepID=UPI000A3B727F|nr:hypothetical protein [Erythrobacter donghaensis]